jgi:hypothetical protein
MVQLSPQNIELELKAYSQKWLLLLSQGDFEQANELISAPMLLRTKALFNNACLSFPYKI